MSHGYVTQFCLCVLILQSWHQHSANGMSIKTRASLLLLNKVSDLIFSIWQNLINNVFFLKAHLKGSPKKAAHRQKTLEGWWCGGKRPHAPLLPTPEGLGFHVLKAYYTIGLKTLLVIYLTNRTFTSNFKKQSTKKTFHYHIFLIWTLKFITLVHFYKFPFF